WFVEQVRDAAATTSVVEALRGGLGLRSERSAAAEEAKAKGADPKIQGAIDKLAAAGKPLGIEIVDPEASDADVAVPGWKARGQPVCISHGGEDGHVWLVPASEPTPEPAGSGKAVYLGGGHGYHWFATLDEEPAAALATALELAK